MIAKVDPIPSSSLTSGNLQSWLDPVFLALGDTSLKARHGKEVQEDVLGCH